MNNVKRYSGSFLDKKISTKRSALFLLFACSFAVFMSPSLSLFLGPVIAFLAFYLYLSEYQEFVTALIIVANDALGTAFLGKVSFQYLLLALVAISLIRKRRISLSEILFFVTALVLQLELVIVGFMDMRSALFSMIYILAILVLAKDNESVSRFFRGVAITVGLLALHACITGGVEFIEYEDYVEIVRKGILGTGIGDPNYSCFLLLIGLICTWCDEKMKKKWKFLLTALIIAAMTVTVSISGLLALIMTIALFLLVGGKRGKRFTTVLIVFLVVTILISVYISAPKELHVEGIDNYIERVTEKLNALRQGDVNAATTNRASLLSDYIAYIFNQPLFSFLLGGDTLNPVGKVLPHNIYIDFILQVGVVGTALMLVWMAVKVKKALELPLEDPARRRTLLLKALAVFFGLNLSLYAESLWGMWMFFCILI